MRIVSQRFSRSSLVITVISSLLLSTSVFPSPWKDSDFISDSVTRASQSQSAKPQSEPLEPLKYRSLELNEFAWKDLLQQNVSFKPSNVEGDEVAEENKLILPLPDGTEVEVIATETSVLAPELALQFPDIKTWKVVGVNQNISGRVDFTSLGFHAMLVMANGDTVFIEPDDDKYGERETSSSSKYLSFSKHENHDHFKTDFKCGVHSESTPVTQSLITSEKTLSETLLARPAFNNLTYRLAIATTGEYTQYYGGSVTSTLSAITTTVNRINQIYERDLSITFQLIAEESDLIYTDPVTDPYSNTDINALIQENILNLNDNAVLGSANYDVGHVFGYGNVGGLAFVGSACNTSYKAGGATGSLKPTGDAFTLDYVAHELGHQMGGTHTFNSDCGGRDVDTAVEPGSGSTIMSYAGLCQSNDLQQEVDAQFHVVSIEQMLKFTREESGNSCGISTAVTNENPEINAGLDFTVPARTPVVLIADGFDTDGDSLSYVWEQADSGTESNVDVDTGDNALFRSIALSSTSIRFIPRLSDLFQGVAEVGEHLPITNRTMELRATVRDGNGGVQYDDSIMTVFDTGTSFRVTSHALSKTYGQGDETEIIWDTAGTNTTPISCQNIDIGLITVDGIGIDIATTSNDGSEIIVIPSDAPAMFDARFIISCASTSTNQFFNISSADLLINNFPGSGGDVGDVVDVASADADIVADTETDVVVAESSGGGTFGYCTLSLLLMAYLRRKWLVITYS